MLITLWLRLAEHILMIQ